MALNIYNSGLEPSYNYTDTALDPPMPVEPCNICQRVVDFLREEPDSYSDADTDTLSACFVATWSDIQHNDKFPTCQKVVETFSVLDASYSCTKDAHIRVTQPWEGSFSIKLRRDCHDEDKDVGFLLSSLGDDTPWVGYLSGVLVHPSWIDVGRIEKWLAQCNSSHNGVCRDAPGMTGIKLPGILYLVDIEKQCITVAEGIPDYVALSYVWAHASNQCELTQENLDFMKQSGSLTSDVTYIWHHPSSHEIKSTNRREIFVG